MRSESRISKKEDFNDVLSRPTLKAKRTLQIESSSEDDDFEIPDLEEKHFKTTWEKTKDANELVRYECFLKGF